MPFCGSHPTGTGLPNETDKHCSFCSLNHNRGRTLYCRRQADLNNSMTRSQVAGHLWEAANLGASLSPGGDAIKGTCPPPPSPQPQAADAGQTRVPCVALLFAQPLVRPLLRICQIRHKVMRCPREAINPWYGSTARSRPHRSQRMPGWKRVFSCGGSREGRCSSCPTRGPCHRSEAAVMS